MHDNEPAQEPEPTTNAAPDAGQFTAAAVPAVQDESPWQWSPLAKTAFVIAGVISPLVCFLVYFVLYGLFPGRRSDGLGGYASALLWLTPSAPFLPMVLYSIISLVLMVDRPQQAVQRFWVRFGIYTGTVMAVHYYLVTSVAMLWDEVGFNFLFFFLATLTLILIWVTGWALVATFGGKPRKLIPTRVVAIGVSTLGLVVVMLTYPLTFLCLLLMPFYGPAPWTVIAYGSMSLYILRRKAGSRWQFSLAQLLGVVFWVAAYCSAWRLSIELMLIEYAHLPRGEPPDHCYVATAAARGHRWLVRAEPTGCARGEAIWVNDQMRYLKAAELVLAATSPWLHRLCRACYDRLGPRAAAMLVGPLLADAAYLALKPAEWAARVLLALLLPDCGHLVEAFYGDRSDAG